MNRCRGGPPNEKTRTEHTEPEEDGTPGELDLTGESGFAMIQAPWG
jgi:hypothetical protein